MARLFVVARYVAQKPRVCMVHMCRQISNDAFYYQAVPVAYINY
jgi:hypothetical protein